MKQPMIRRCLNYLLKKYSLASNQALSLFSHVVIFLSLFCIMSPGFADQSTGTADRPNILWLTIEDTSLFFGCYGDPVAKTPNIDRLATQGTRFTRAFASSPVCSAARSAMITGMHVGKLGVGDHRSTVQIPASIKGYPYYLRQAGYYCTNHTKNDFNFTTAGEFAKECWDDNSQSAHWRNRDDDQPFFSIFNFNVTHQSRTSVNSYERFARLYQSQLHAEDITSPDEIVLPPFYHDSPRMRKAYARVYDCITLVDKQVGERLQQLEDDGLAEDTIVIFFSDHGQGIPRYKTFPFAMGFRVPMIIRVPEKFRHLLPLEPGTVRDDIVSFVDLGPTMLQLIGEPIPEQMTGRPLLNAGGKLTEKKKYFYGSLNDVDSTENHSRTICDGRFVYIRNYMRHLPYCQAQAYCDSGELMRYIREDHAAGILTGPAAEFMANSRPAEALYDLENDPWEINNLVGDPAYAAKLSELRLANRERVLELRDLHFLHAWEIDQRGNGQPPASFRDNEELYPLTKILKVAETCGRGPQFVDQQLASLQDKEPMCRFWAIIGLQSQPELNERILSSVEGMLSDSAPYLRYEAAAFCCQHHPEAREQAMKVLVDGINEPHSILANHAMRKIAVLGKSVAEILDDVNAAEKHLGQLKDRKRISGIRNSAGIFRRKLSGQLAKPQDRY